MFALRYQLANHNRSVHTAEMRFACELCPSKFRRKTSLDRHKQLHERGVDLCHCPECGKTFERTTALQQHLKWHKKDKPYPCHLCLARFTKRQNLEDHLQTHTGEKLHKCTVCQKRFAWRAGLKLHIRRIHGGAAEATPEGTADISLLSASPSTARSPGPLNMDGTPQTTSTETSGDVAILDSNSGISGGTLGAPLKKPGSRGHECGVCGRRFKWRHCLKNHQVLHTGEKPYACSICGRKFAQRTGFLNHRRNHTAEMRFACELCPSKFRRKISLDRHKQLHEKGVDLCHCPECGKTFERMTALQWHLQWHERDKPYPCHLCPARFINKVDRDNHVLVHTGEKPHKCPVCEKGFAWWCNLKAHMRSTHGSVKTAEASVEQQCRDDIARQPSRSSLVYCYQTCYSFS
ncbi:zinc finger protein 90 [Dermacentor silvarum]|uniref:zinc finger protein 90 n=1 Tax=Dermacentor silvarum TaxID=543639 RepID=UPI00189A790C|nr:zinc finger protein 90 [Dermacentor silvarum]